MKPLYDAQLSKQLFHILSPIRELQLNRALKRRCFISCKHWKVSVYSLDLRLFGSRDSFVRYFIFRGSKICISTRRGRSYFAECYPADLIADVLEQRYAMFDNNSSPEQTFLTVCGTIGDIRLKDFFSYELCFLDLDSDCCFIVSSSDVQWKIWLNGTRSSLTASLSSSLNNLQFFFCVFIRSLRVSVRKTL